MLILNADRRLLNWFAQTRGCAFAPAAPAMSRGQIFKILLFAADDAVSALCIADLGAGGFDGGKDDDSVVGGCYIHAVILSPLRSR